MAGTVALILAGGRGTRIGGDLPKQYREIAGTPMLRRTIDAFAGHPRVDAVCCVIHRDDLARYREITADLGIEEPAFGGTKRQESSYNGLRHINKLSPNSVLIQDAARPHTESGTIDRVLDALRETPAALAAVPVTDTLKRGDGRGHVVDTVDRQGLWRAQTPQGFRYRDILAAHEAAAGQAFTDDAAVVEAAGLAITLVPGHENNIKVTTEQDFMRSDKMVRELSDEHMKDMTSRVGMGFDVHRFEPGAAVVLCGITIPHVAKLKGHSDADVGLHAITDAILGAIGDGDIGDHFPPTDDRWRGADSALFLSAAAAFVRDRGGRINHIDVTLICERPKIGPHRSEMRKRIAEICEIPAERVNVKATTTEKLGFTGREEGIAAQAVATVVL